MPFKVIVPQAISRAIGQCGINRNTLLRLLHFIHEDLPGDAAKYRGFRDPEDDRQFICPLRLLDDGQLHLFSIVVDDTTANDCLILTGLRHVRENDFLG